MRRTLSFLFVALASLTTLSCGGGGGEIGASQRNGNSGNLSYTYSRASQVQPAVFSNSSGAVVTGLTGANFTKVQLNPIKAIAATKIAFSVDGQLWLMNYDGSNAQPIGPTNLGASTCSPSWYPNGTLLAITHLDSGNVTQIYRINPDGTGFQKLTNSVYNAFAPAWSPSGTKIAFSMYDLVATRFRIFTMNPDGSGQTAVSPTGVDAQYPAWSPDGSKIYCSFFNSSGYWDFGSVPAAGGPITSQFAAGLVGATNAAISIQGEGAYSNFTSIIGGTFGGSTFYTLTNPGSNAYDTDPAFSPDGQDMLFTRFVTGGKSTIWHKHAGAQSEQETPLTDASRNYNSAAWSPFPGNRTLIGTGGPLGVTASGFLFGEVGDVTQSVLSFACTTPGTATITAQSSGGNVSNAVFQISGDAITALKYIPDVYSTAVTIIPGSFTTAKGALVSFNATTGRVVLVAPYASSKRAVSKTGGLAYDGQFLGVWKDGKNVASSAAHLEVGANGALLNVK